MPTKKAKPRKARSEDLAANGSPSSSPHTRTTRAKVARVVELRQQVKDAYEEMDALLDQLMDNAELYSTPIKVAGTEYILADNFIDKNVQWRASAFRRFDLVEYKANGKNKS